MPRFEVPRLPISPTWSSTARRWSMRAAMSFHLSRETLGKATVDCLDLALDSSGALAIRLQMIQYRPGDTREELIPFSGGGHPAGQLRQIPFGHGVQHLPGLLRPFCVDRFHHV